MKTHYETIVVGAGAAGMNCCLELQKNDREYLLISPNIGGRICNDEERHMNYGAVFYFGTYKYMLRSELLIEGPDVLPALSAGCCHHDNGKQYEPVSPYNNCRRAFASEVHEVDARGIHPPLHQVQGQLHGDGGHGSP